MTFVGCAATLYYRTKHVQYPKIDFWRAEFFLGRTYDTIPTYGRYLSTYMMYGSIFTVYTHTDGTGRDGTGRDGTDGRTAV